MGSYVLLLPLLFSLLCAIVSSRGIPTKICDVTSLNDLVDLQTKVDFARISCEGEQFKGYQCSQYWMLNNDLIQKKLSFAWCRADKRKTFRNWAGSRNFIGAFQNDFISTLKNEITANDNLRNLLSVEHNITLDLTIQESDITLQLLEDKMNLESNEIQVFTFHEESNTRSGVSSQESKTRDSINSASNSITELEIEKETLIRDNVLQNETSTRDFTSEVTQELRLWDQQQEGEIRNDTTEQHANINDLENQSHHTIRETMKNETEITESLWLQKTNNAQDHANADKRSDMQNTTAQATSEESITRTLVLTTDTNNIEYNTVAEQQNREALETASTNALYETSDTVGYEGRGVRKSVADSKASISSTQEFVSNQNAWSAASGNIFSLLGSFQDGTESILFNTISIHWDLIRSSTVGFPAVSAYTNNLSLFTSLRSIVNETLVYNKQKYPATDNSRNAQTSFTKGEDQLKLAKPDYRMAVKHYSVAYVFAITHKHAFYFNYVNNEKLFPY